MAGGCSAEGRRWLHEPLCDLHADERVAALEAAADAATATDAYDGVDAVYDALASRWGHS